MRHIVTPTCEALQMAVEFVKSGKCAVHQVIAFAAMLDGYLSGIITTDISFDENDTPVVTMRVNKGPEDADEDGRSVSPTDEELQERGFYELIEPRAVTFLCAIPDFELALMSECHMTKALRSMLSRLAKEELERRRAA